MIEILAWTPDRATFVTGMTQTRLPIQVGVAEDGSPIMAPQEAWPALCQLAEDGTTLIPLPGIVIDEVGEIVKTPAVLAEDGTVVTPAVTVGGHHVNLLAHGEIEALLTAGLPQTDADGNLLDVFTRTHILTLIPGMEWHETQVGEPPGWVGPNGVKLFDPAAVSQRRRVWFGV